jgi:hypothetical protein
MSFALFSSYPSSPSVAGASIHTIVCLIVSCLRMAAVAKIVHPITKAQSRRVSIEGEKKVEGEAACRATSADRICSQRARNESSAAHRELLEDVRSAPDNALQVPSNPF